MHPRFRKSKSIPRRPRRCGRKAAAALTNHSPSLLSRHDFESLLRKSRQKEAAGAADAGLMQIEWSERGV